MNNTLNLEWYHRVSENLEEELYTVCSIAESLIVNGHLEITTSESEKHPTISIYCNFEVAEQDIDKPIVIHFDPYNQEFYTLLKDEDNEIRLMLKNADAICSYIHEKIHEAHLMFMVMEEAPEVQTFAKDLMKTFSELVGNGIKHGDSTELFAKIGELYNQHIGDQVESKEINWFGEEFIINSEIDEEIGYKTVTSIRLGEFIKTETFVLGRVERGYFNNEFKADSELLFPFPKKQISIIHELLSKQLSKQ
ncbi:hypothetical protein [Viridibacillus arvi]|uniref:hypothetical protein n=1 Tax=Viridibacillus arvi TaxID=263475 RepID=UPI0034CD6E05